MNDLMHHAACKVEFQPFNRPYSQLTSFNFFIYKILVDTSLCCGCHEVLVERRKKVSNNSQTRKIKMSAPTLSVVVLVLSALLQNNCHHATTTVILLIL